MNSDLQINPVWLNGRAYKQDQRVRYSVMPTRLVWSDAGNGEIKDIDALMRDDNSSCEIRSKGGPASIVFDFGQELNGGVFLDIAPSEPNVRPVKLRLRFGESVSECMAQPDTTHAIHDITFDFPSYGKHEIGCTGFRFVRIDVLDEDVLCPLRQVKAVALERPFEYKGSFECSDDMLNRVWQIGARTVHLCCQDYIYDGVKRDRLVWMGDMHPQIRVIAAAFGDVDIVTETMDHILGNIDTEKDWLNGISSYSIWWIMILWDWYLFTGKKEYLASQRSRLLNCINLLLDHVDETGREKLTGVRFLDWSMASIDQAEVTEGLQALTTWALQISAKIMQEIGEAEMSERCLSTAALMQKVDAGASSNKHVNAMRVLAGLVDAATANKESLQVDPYQGLSPWYGYYVLQARAEAGDYEGALDLIRNYWGGMVNLGATSFWEHFEVDWVENAGRIDEIVPDDKCDVHKTYGDHCYRGLRHSLCHGWAGGPTAWLTEHILGVKPMAPGCKKVAIAPNLGDLQYAKGLVPTPQGIIKVSHQRDATGTVQTEYELPEGVEVVKN